MREVAEREAGIGVRQLVVDDAGGDRVHAGAAVGVGDGDADEAQAPELAQERRVERLRLVVLHRLRLDAGLDELVDRLAEELVLLGATDHEGLP